MNFKETCYALISFYFSFGNDKLHVVFHPNKQQL